MNDKTPLEKNSGLTDQEIANERLRKKLYAQHIRLLCRQAIAEIKRKERKKIKQGGGNP